ncbi:MAG: 5-(carboxyamino)imidazole ribonucleotide synthase [Pseudomonadota bacterium]
MTSTTIGIAGAGQLGAYLCRAARDLGVRTVLLASRADEIAIPLADDVLIGPMADLALFDALAQRCDVVTYEREDLPVAALDRLEQHEAAGIARIAPSTRILRTLQNKATQKAWLTEQGLPTAPFVTFDAGLDRDAASRRFGDRYVVKSQRGGYDGQGVAIVRDGVGAEHYGDTPCIVEAYVRNRQEFATLLARTPNGEHAIYPPLETTFYEAGNVLRQVICPSALDATQAARAIELGVAVVDGLDAVGVFAIELFLSEGELLINEISPRVHNTGHLTIEGHNTSQFEQHVRAIAGLPLGDISPRSGGAAMNNLLFEPAIERACVDGLTLDAPDVHVHWYGKSDPRPGRKMGHLTTLAEDGASAAASADAAFEQLGDYK